MIQIFEAIIYPILVLNKSDLESDENEYRQLEHLKSQMPIFKTIPFITSESPFVFFYVGCPGSG